jgi:TIR domain
LKGGQHVQGVHIINDLVAKSPVSIFFAPWAIDTGESLVEKIETALVESDVFIPLLSPNSLNADFAQRELRSATQLAMRKRIAILPVKIGPCDLPPLLADLKYIDFIDHDYRSAAEQLVRSLSPGRDPLRDLESLARLRQGLWAGRAATAVSTRQQRMGLAVGVPSLTNQPRPAVR